MKPVLLTTVTIQVHRDDEDVAAGFVKAILEYGGNLPALIAELLRKDTK